MLQHAIMDMPLMISSAIQHASTYQRIGDIKAHQP